MAGTPYRLHRHLLIVVLAASLGAGVGLAVPYLHEHQTRKIYPRDRNSDETLRHFREMDREDWNALVAESHRNALLGGTMAGSLALIWPLLSRRRVESAPPSTQTDA